jgi:hypothetical protein
MYLPQKHPDSVMLKVEAEDCSGNSMPIASSISWINATTSCVCAPGHFLPQVSNPSPPDSAENVPLNARMTWDTFDPEHGVSQYAMFFGTTPAPPQVAENFEGNSYEPGPLLPGAHYYWQVGVWIEHHFAISRGPVWTFKTMDTTPVEYQTWGAIKALYN